MSFIYKSRGRSNCPRRVFVAVPVGDGKPFANCVSALLNAEMALHEAGWAMDIAIEANNCHVDDTRNSLVREFLQSDCSDFVFIDADVGWREDALPRLLSYDRDIVAGVYPKKTDKTEFPVYLPKGPLWAEADGLLEVERVPTGFLRIRRVVLEALAASAAKFTSNEHKDGDAPYPLIFERMNNTTDARRWSGDYAFCNKAKAAGFRVFVDPEMHFSHAGVKVWSGCLGDHLRERAGLDHPAFTKAVEAIRAGNVSAETVGDLYWRSGNEWAAPPEMLLTAWHMASKIGGNILECGSGLTTIILGLAAERYGGIVHTLEHDIEWCDRIRDRLRRYDVGTVRVHYAPLRDRDGCRWYEVPRELPRFDLVVCDGPPRKYGRDGLVKRLGHLTRNAALLMDDVADPRMLDLARTFASGRAVHVIEARTEPDRKFAIVTKHAQCVEQPEPMRAFA